jgi:UDP-glucose 4-epimerase
VKVLVTGGAGFVGSHLIERLVQEPDIELVRAVDNLSNSRRENLDPFLSRIEFIEGDLLQQAIREKATQGIDVIFHEAAIPSVPRSVEQPLISHQNGVHLTIQLLESARQAGVRRVVFAASSSAYGDTPRLPKQEDMPPNPLSPYAATKVACEQYLRAYARCFPIDTVSLRYFNVFGPRQNPSSQYSGVIARFCLAFCRRQPLIIFGDGEQSRDFTYIENVVQANLLAARHPESLQGNIFNIGAGQRTSLNDLVDLLNEITGQDRRPEHQAERAGDVRHSLADIARAQEQLGYHPAVSLREGLEQTLAWYKEELSATQAPAASPASRKQQRSSRRGGVLKRH